MRIGFRLVLLSLCLFCSAKLHGQNAGAKNAVVADIFVCLPCGESCDTLVFEVNGICQRCDKTLVKKSTVKAKKIAPDLICRYLKENPEVVLLDIRSEGHLVADRRTGPNIGSLKNDIKFPLEQFSKRRRELNTMKEKNLVLYCSTGFEAPAAAYILTEWGFPHVSYVEGGIYRMKDSGCKK